MRRRYAAVERREGSMSNEFLVGMGAERGHGFWNFRRRILDGLVAEIGKSSGGYCKGSGSRILVVRGAVGGFTERWERDLLRARLWRLMVGGTCGGKF